MRPSLRATVMIPTTGDRGPLLPYSVGSVLNQSVAEIEVFVMGDGVDEDTRAVIAGLVRDDSRVRFFDHPKHARRGEPYRHSALAEARGAIVCYLTDRDLMLPDHVAIMEQMLADADFAQTLRFNIEPGGHLSFMPQVEAAGPRDRAALSSVEYSPPLPFAGHTLAAYRRLPHGWRTTPPGLFTDRYMFRQFLDRPDCRAAISTWPTVLYFKRGHHPGLPVAERLAELKVWHAKLAEPGWVAAFSEEVRSAAIRDKARYVLPPTVANVLRARFPAVAAALGLFPAAKAALKRFVR